MFWRLYMVPKYIFFRFLMHFPLKNMAISLVIPKDWVFEGFWKRTVYAKNRVLIFRQSEFLSKRTKKACNNPGFFLHKTKKLSSGFSKTHIPKNTENSVFAQKLSSKCIKNWVFREIFSQNQPKNLDFSPKPLKFLENSVPKTKKLSFSEISETWKA